MPLDEVAVDGADAVDGEGAAPDGAVAGREGGSAASLPVPPIEVSSGPGVRPGHHQTNTP